MSGILGIQIESTQLFIEEIRIVDGVNNITKPVIINAKLIDRSGILPDLPITFLESQLVAQEVNFNYGSTGLVDIQYEFAETTEVNGKAIGFKISKRQALDLVQ